MDRSESQERDARLVMLKALAEERDGRLPETMLTEWLSVSGYSRSRDWVRTQLRKLADLGAVRLTDAGPQLVATLTAAGLDHVERRGVIEGVALPSRAV